MKYALIGCGRIAKNHITAALNNNLEIVAVCDIKPEKMSDLLDAYGLSDDNNISFYADYNVMLREHKEIELIAIATESGSHAAIALECIRAKKNLIIEKPIALSMADANEIIKQSNENQVVVSACHQNRFNQAIKKLREAIEQQRFGKLSHGSIHVRWNRGESYYHQAPWRGTWAEDGGCLMNQCIHGIDILRWMMGDEVDEVYGVTGQQFHDYLEAEDVGTAIVKFKNGSIGIVEGTTNVFPKNLEETLYIFGETGTVKVGGTSTNTIDVWEFKNATEADMMMAGFREETSNVYGNGHTLLYADVIEAIRTSRRPYVDAVAGRNALEMVLAIYKSQQTGQPVKLPLEDFASINMMGEFS